MKAFCLLLLLSSYVASIKFPVLPNTERCIKEEFQPDTLIKGTAEVSPVLIDMQLAFRIIDHDSNPVYENRDVSKAIFAFTSSQTETEYSFCFTENYNGAERQARQVTLNMDVGEKEKNYDDIAKKENLKPIELELRKMLDAVTNLQLDFHFVKTREATHRDTNESTNSRVVFMSFASVAILVGLGVAQIYYLKKYFKSKKLI